MTKRTTSSEAVQSMRVKAGPMHPSGPAQAPLTTQLISTYTLTPVAGEASASPKVWRRVRE